MTLNPIIDFSKCHFLQQGDGGLSEWKKCNPLVFFLPPALSSAALPAALCLAARKQHCDVCLPALIIILFHSSPTRIHPSPTAGSITAASSASTVQGKPSLRRIKGRIHRSKSLDSMDLLDSNVSSDITSSKKQRRALHPSA